MLKYITIPLSSECESYCHFPDTRNLDAAFISPDMLSRIVVWAMKENLSIQFVYPQRPIPESLETVIESVDHVKIVPGSTDDIDLLQKADIVIMNGFGAPEKLEDKIFVVKVGLSSLIGSFQSLTELIMRARKVNVVIYDVSDFTKDDIDKYRSFLKDTSDFIAEEYIKGNNPQLNLITDRMFLTHMNNCNAGDESIAVSNEGVFYPCPGFIGDAQFSCGDIESGFGTPSIRLYNIKNAPICKICDAWHCKRCVWLNRMLTHEVNTPGWQQCHMSHLEREASKNTLDKIRAVTPGFMEEISIPKLEYYDPYQVVERL